MKYDFYQNLHWDESYCIRCKKKPQVLIFPDKCLLDLKVLHRQQVKLIMVFSCRIKAWQLKHVFTQWCHSPIMSTYHNMSRIIQITFCLTTAISNTRALVSDVIGLRCKWLQAKRILIVAFGENKVGAVADAVEGNITDQCAASHLQKHGNTLMHLDLAAAHGWSSPCPLLFSQMRLLSADREQQQYQYHAGLIAMPCNVRTTLLAHDLWCQKLIHWSRQRMTRKVHVGGLIGRPSLTKVFVRPWKGLCLAWTAQRPFLIQFLSKLCFAHQRSGMYNRWCLSSHWSYPSFPRIDRKFGDLLINLHECRSGKAEKALDSDVCEMVRKIGAASCDLAGTKASEINHQIAGGGFLGAFSQCEPIIHKAKHVFSQLSLLTKPNFWMKERAWIRIRFCWWSRSPCWKSALQGGMIFQ